MKQVYRFLATFITVAISLSETLFEGTTEEMTLNPLHSQMNILILAVVRSSDKTVIAQFIRNKEVTIEGVRECIASNARMAAGKRYTSQGPEQSIHYTLDPQGRVFAMVTVNRYSPRVAFAALDEFQTMFNKELGMKAAGALEGQLTQASKPIFKHLYEKFENPANVDKLVSVSEKVEVVKTVMKDNISEILKNTEKLEELEEKSKNLDNQAMEFQRGAKDLSTKMFWKKWKMRLLLAFLIISVLVLIIVPTAVSSSSSSKK